VIVEVIAVGTEMLLGQIVNSNAAHIGERLAEAGLDHYRQTVVGDNLERIAAAVAEAAARADAVIITGGLGPTQDDLTRPALAAAAGVGLVFDEEQAERLRDFWRRRGRDMPRSNLRQAERPDGSSFIDNPKGTAPGIDMEIRGARVLALPGVPIEMEAMLDDHVIPALGGATSGVVRSRLLRSWGDSESAVAELLGDLYDGSTNPTIAFLASRAEIKVRITAKADSVEEADALIEPVEAEVRRRLGHRIFGADDETIEVIVLRLLEERGWTLGTAESATGGMVASRITSVPGASKVYAGSIVTYTNTLKEQLLGVHPALIDEHGVVSRPVAEAMAEGARSILGVDCAIAVTGSAGPEPLEQPQGTLVVAVATVDGTASRLLMFPGDRERVRVFGSTAALHWLRLSLQGVEWGED
jgi:competence/damage-inducible protein CinA-like protein